MLNFTSHTPSPSSASRSQELQLLLNTLSQADYISVTDWSSWVPASASTTHLSIKGAISLDPAPTRRAQFISLGIRPLSAHSGHNEIYDEIDRIFCLSSFGTVEEHVDLDEGEKYRRANDNRFKSDGYTNQQLKGRKGVDRYPMFHLRIYLKDSQTAKLSEGQFFDQETNLQAVLEVLRAMITQWLSVHHFRPRKLQSRRDRPNTASTSTSEDDRPEQTSKLGRTPPPIRSKAGDEPSRPGSTKPESRKRKASAKGPSKESNKRLQPSPFSDWSRMRSGKPDFYDNLWGPGKRLGLTANDDNPLMTPPTTNESVQQAPAPESCATFNIEPIEAGSLNPPSRSLNTPQKTPTPRDETISDSQTEDRDETLAWTNPSTKETFLLNARTGCVIPKVAADPSLEAASSQLKEPSKTLRLSRRPKDGNDSNNPWLNGLLKTWDNPIFKPTEKRIQQVAHNEHDQGNASKIHSHCSQISLNNSPNDLYMSTLGKLSKEGLRSAQLIAQLDKKFILIKMSNSPEQPTSGGEESEVLVLIDQHAADERIRVEYLFTELCTPMPDTENHYYSKLGHRSKVAFSVLEKALQFSISQHEGALFSRHASAFAAWGILYDIPTTKTSSARMPTSERPQPLLSVTALPPGISERCKSDPKLLISFLRTAVHKYAEDPHYSSSIETLLENNQELSTRNNTSASPAWLKRLASCPPGLVDLINSRACRSAIMFNDELDMGQCEDLVTSLAKCVFPFMCAHGRPSMVPLVNLGSKGDVKGLGLGLGEGNEGGENGGGGSFVEAWKRWKGK